MPQPLDFRGFFLTDLLRCPFCQLVATLCSFYVAFASLTFHLLPLSRFLFLSVSLFLFPLPSNPPPTFDARIPVPGLASHTTIVVCGQSRRTTRSILPSRTASSSGYPRTRSLR